MEGIILFLSVKIEEEHKANDGLKMCLNELGLKLADHV